MKVVGRPIELFLLLLQHVIFYLSISKCLGASHIFATNQLYKLKGQCKISEQSLHLFWLTMFYLLTLLMAGFHANCNEDSLRVGLYWPIMGHVPFQSLLNVAMNKADMITCRIRRGMFVLHNMFLSECSKTLCGAERAPGTVPFSLMGAV